MELKGFGVWTPIDFFNNKIVCELIEQKRPAGVIAYLDEECIYPQASDATLMSKLNKNLAGHPHFVPGSKASAAGVANTFIIKHFAGDVTYNINGFLEKNKDTLFSDLIACMGSSTNHFISSLFPEVHQAASRKRPLQYKSNQKYMEYLRPKTQIHRR